MELSINPEQKGENSNETPVIYTAYGWVSGVFQPQKKRKNKKLQGMLITEDGQEIPAILDWYILHRLNKKIGDKAKVAEFLQSVHQWQVYPRTQPLRFDIMKIRMQPCEEQKAAKKNRQDRQPRELDKFRVVGKIRYIADDKVVMRIERNEKVPNRSNNTHPLYLKLAGSIPTGEIGQIWELEVWRCGTKLTISKAKVYQPSEDDIKLFKLLREQKASQTSKPDAPAKEASLALDEVKATVVEHIDSAPLSDLQQEKNKHSPVEEAAATNAAKAEVQTTSAKEKKQGNFVAPKSATPIAGKCEPKVQQQSSRFSVQVNGQVFIGQESVALNRRVLFIDSKPVAQSKLAVVVGQPKTMQADGSVSTGGGRSVLMSK